MLNELLQKQTLVAILIGLSGGMAGAAEMPSGEREVGIVQEEGAGSAEAERDVYDDWRLDCAEAGCAVLTRVVAADGTEVLRVEAGGARAVLRFVTVLGLHLPDGLAAAIGAEVARDLVWRTCGPGAGCVAEVPLDGELLGALRRERGGTATLSLVEGVPVRLGFSLIGFSAAWRALEEAEAAR